MSVLDDVPRRMQERQRGKRPQLRALRVWRPESGAEPNHRSQEER